MYISVRGMLKQIFNVDISQVFRAFFYKLSVWSSVCNVNVHQLREKQDIQYFEVRNYFQRIFF